MANITLTINVPDIAAVLAVYDRVQLYRSTDGAAGEYAYLAELALTPGATQYTYQDATSDPAYYYKSAYSSSVKGLISPLSAPFGGATDPALAALSVQDLKDRFLFGVDLTDRLGNPIPDAVFENAIRSAVQRIAGLLDLCLVPTTVLNERKDYVPTDANQFFWTHLSKRPVQTVTAFRLHIPGATPLTFPKNWVEVQERQGIVQVVPQSTISVVPGAAYASPYFTQIFLTATKRRIPNACEVDYVAGFPAGQIPFDILDIVGKAAAVGPLRQAGNILLGAGIAGQSIGIDGLSQSVSLTKQGNGAFAAMVSDLQRDIDEAIPILRSVYNGLMMRVV